LVDKWFRLLEMSLVLGVLFYFSFALNIFYLKVFAYISSGVFLLFAVELGNSAIKIIGVQQKLGKITRFLIYLMSLLIIIMVFVSMISVAILLAQIREN